VEPRCPAVLSVPCTIRQVRWSHTSLSCPQCGNPAPRVWDVTRIAIDIDLEQPVILAVDVSVHRCRPCSREFRAQPPFLRPDAIYTRRVVQKAVEAVYCDGLAARSVPDRLARDFYVRPSEKMVRLWCKAFADRLDFAADYQAWVIASFSGILCVDEVYQGKLALLLAVDPAAPDGDRLVGYALVPKGVDAADVKAFLARLKAAGIEPAEVITDDSTLYPPVLSEIWPTAAHQLCLFHTTRRVVEAVNDVVKHVRRTLPSPPPAKGLALGGRLRQTPPRSDEHDPAAERYRWCQARRVVGIAQAHALRPQIQSTRALARAVGVNQDTVRRWLQLPLPDPATLAQALEAVGSAPSLEPPPEPWRDWDQVRQIREDLRLNRTLFLRRPDHLSADEQQTLADLLASPAGAMLRVARAFLEEWFAIWRDEDGHRRSPAEAQRRYYAWRDDAAAAALVPLRKQQQHLDPEHFARLSVFLHHPEWEPTNNAAERGGRGFRHSQHPHFRLRNLQVIDADLKVHAYLQKERAGSTPLTRLHQCQRGRQPHRSTSTPVAA